MRILQRNLKRTTDTFLFISHTTTVLLFKFSCNVFVNVRISKEMPGAVASGTHCISLCIQKVFLTQRTYSSSNFVAISSLVLELLKKCRIRKQVGHPVFKWLINISSGKNYVRNYLQVSLFFSAQIF